MLTQEQKDIINFDDNLIVNAGPGSGKTFTIIQYVLNYIKNFPKENVLIVVFNDAIAKEINVKINHPNIYCYTLHTLGSAILKHANTGFKFNKYLNENRNSKYKTILKQSIGYFKGSNVILNNCMELINLGRMTNVNFDSAPELYKLALRHDIEIVGDELSHIAIAVNEGIKQFINFRWYDFADMLYIPMKLNLRLKPGDKIGYGANEKIFNKPFGLIVGDEAQDFGYTMQTVIKQFANDKTKFAFFGDSRQSINGFTGSDPDSFTTLQLMYDCAELELNTIFRCPQSHVKNLNETYGTNFISNKSEYGVIEERTYSDMIANLQSGDVVLGRFANGKEAKLWNIFFDLLIQNKNCSLFGLDAFQLYEKHVPEDIKKGKNYKNLYANLSAHAKEILEEYNSKNWKNVADTYETETNILLQLISYAPTTTFDSFADWLKTLSYDRKNTINLSTVHKAKGKEWNTVYIVDENKMPLQPKQDWQIQQERFVKYVAQTRSLHNMYYVNE